MIQLENISKKYGQKQVLQNINFSFEPGLVYGIVGKNGAGKSTLFRCLAGLENYAGEINAPFEPLKNQLGLLETNPIMLTRITGWEYLKLMCIARGIQSNDFNNQNIFELPLDQYASTYSTGMKKKLALMGLLLQHNQVFLLDEPFNGLDLQSNITVIEIIKQLKEAQTYMLLCSHLFSTLKELCDCILLLEHGQFAASYLPNSYDALEDHLSAQQTSIKVKDLFDRE